jgi:hypothetical protein
VLPFSFFESSNGVGNTNDACSVELAKSQRWYELCLASLANSLLIATWLLGKFLGYNLADLRGAQYVTLQQYFSHLGLVILLFCNPTYKIETGQQIGGGLIIANHLNQ